MVGKLLFTLPLVASGDYDLIYAADGAIKTFHRDRGAIDDILIAALHNDVMELIKLSRLVPSWPLLYAATVVYMVALAKLSCHIFVHWCVQFSLQ